jgi:hypothetical protein
MDTKKIIKKIKLILISVDNKQKELILLNNTNINKLNKYLYYLEELILEYHNVCKKIYNK